MSINEPRHNCLAGEHYPKRIPDRWNDEKGKPTELSNQLASYAMAACALGIMAIAFIWTFGMVGMNPFAFDELLTADQVREQKQQLLKEIRAMSCDDQAKKIAGKEWSTRGLISDSYFANQEYKYLCLGVERPVAPEINHDPRVGRK